MREDHGGPHAAFVGNTMRPRDRVPEESPPDRSRDTDTLHASIISRVHRLDRAPRRHCRAR